MADLISEILGFIVIAALLGVVIGYLIWGFGRRAALASARADGVRAARTSVDGNEPLRAQLEAALTERDDLKAQVTQLRRANKELPTVDTPHADTVESDLPGDEADRDPGLAEAAETVALIRPVALVPEPVAPDPEPAQEFVEPERDDPAPEPLAAPASLLAEAPSEPDDLKRIKGVGPKMERILNDKGVYMFEQIATFSAADVAWVNEAIEAFPGRIERDRWVDQAQELYRTTHGAMSDEQG